MKSIILKHTYNLSTSASEVGIPGNHPLATQLLALQTAFDQEVRHANDGANARLEALKTQLFEAQTAIAERQSLIETRESEMSAA